MSTADYWSIGLDPKTSVIRSNMRNLAQSCWRENLKTSFKSMVDRFRWADEQATTPIYALVDDDCLPCPWLDLKEVEELFDHYPEYGLLALDLGHPASVYEDENIKQCHSVGGIRFLRRGMVSDWKGFTGDDSDHAARMLPFKSAYLKKFPVLHMGQWHSVWQR